MQGNPEPETLREKRQTEKDDDFKKEILPPVDESKVPLLHLLNRNTFQSSTPIDSLEFDQYVKPIKPIAKRQVEETTVVEPEPVIDKYF